MVIARMSGLRDARQALLSGNVSATVLIEQALTIAQATQPTLNAFASITRHSALEAAAYSDRRYAAGTQRALEGLPIGVKDLIDTQGLETRYGSPACLGNVPSANAQVVQVLVEQGAIIIGKTTTHEFAWGVTTSSSEFGDTFNPLDTRCIPGGSSGGAAAAIAGGAVAAGLGTDTGGSVRIPAAMCGVTGFKPTYGRFPTQGIFALAPSLDHPGLLGASVSDVMLLAAALGIAPDDRPVVAPRFKIISQVDQVPMSAAVAQAFEHAVDSVRKVYGCDEVDTPGLFEGAFQAFAQIVLTEGGVSHFARHDWDFIKRHYGAETVERLERSRAVVMSDYANAQTVRRTLRVKLEQAMAGVDYLLLATCPCTAPRVGQSSLNIGAWQGTVREALMTYTAPFNLAGFPAISIPLPLRAPDSPLPASLQIVGRAGDDAGLLRIAMALESLLAEGC